MLQGLTKQVELNDARQRLQLAGVQLDETRDGCCTLWAHGLRCGSVLQLCDWLLPRRDNDDGNGMTLRQWVELHSNKGWDQWYAGMQAGSDGDAISLYMTAAMLRLRIRLYT
eukprot:gene20481-8914_t